MSPFDLHNRRALITGSTHGIGLAMAEAIGNAGAEIIISSTNQSRLTQTVQELQHQGLKVSGFHFDVTNEHEVEQTVNKIEQNFGPIDILINNAGLIQRIPLIEMGVSDFRRILDVNLTGTFILSKYVAKYMIGRNQGKIINICSLMSEIGRESVGAYSAAKGGLKMLTKSMAVEWAKFNIQVNGIGPGYIKTDQTQAIHAENKPLNDFIISRTPTGSWGIPEDIGSTAVFLSSQASNFINGQIIYVDGGLLSSLGRPILKD